MYIFLFSVSGFEHDPYDEKLATWATHLFPYKLGQYRKKLLSVPTCVGELDFTGVAEDVVAHTPLVISEAGRCDCVAIWVDYCLWAGSEENRVRTKSPTPTSTSSALDTNEMGSAIAARDNAAPVQIREHFIAGDGDDNGYTVTEVAPVDTVKSAGEAEVEVKAEVEAVYLRAWDGDDFPFHLTVTLKFLPEVGTVQPGTEILCTASFEVGSSDFDFNFAVMEE